MAKTKITTALQRDQLIDGLHTEKDLQEFAKKYSFATPTKVIIREKIKGTYTQDIIDKYLPIKQRKPATKSGLESAFVDAVKGLSAEVKKALKSDLDTLITKINEEQDKQAQKDAVSKLSVAEIEALLKEKKEAANSPKKKPMKILRVTPKK